MRNPGTHRFPEVKEDFSSGVCHSQGTALLAALLTSVAPLHVRAQPHCVRTGTRVLGGVAGDLRSRKAQVLTAAVGLGTQLAGICSYGQRERWRERVGAQTGHVRFSLLPRTRSCPLGSIKTLSLLLLSSTFHHWTCCFIPTFV